MLTSEQAKQLRALADRVETLVGVIDIPTLVAAGPDMFGDFNLTPRDETAAVAAVVSNLRPPEVVKASAILIAILWHHAPEIAQILRAHASLIDADTGEGRS